MELNAPQPAVRRDRWGRYLVVPPDGGKPRGYTRATTVAKILDDTSNLERWSSRMVALGLSKRPDLLAQVATLADDDRTALNDLCDKAKEAGGATIRRDLGTAMHTMFERTCTEAGYVAPPPYDADMAAIHEALALNGLRLIGMHERIVVNDTHEIAGTFDFIIERVADGKLFIGDLKTGSDVKYGAGGYAVQLAIYATADALYTQGVAVDGSDDVREPMPAVETNLGIIVHCEPGSARCDLYWIDLTTGRGALELAVKVRAIRKFDPLVPIVPTPEQVKAKVDAHFGETVDVTAYVDEQWRTWMRGRIAAVIGAGHDVTLAAAWPADLPTLGSGLDITVEQGNRIDQVLRTVERELELPFPEPAGDDTPATRRTVATYTPPDEGGPIDADAIATVNQRLRGLDDESIEWVHRIVTDCHADGRDVRLSGTGAQPSVRRLTICAALVALAGHRDDELLRTLVGIATGDDIQTAVSLGRAVGSLSIDEAQRLHRLADAIDDLTLRLAYGDDGAVVIVGDTDAAVAA